MTDNKLYSINGDILSIMINAQKIGWNSLKEQSIQRILYLSKVLFYFTHSVNNIFDYYYFSVSLHGPYCSMIENSIAFLKSNQFIEDDPKGNLVIKRLSPAIDCDKNKWLKTIILILGKYGENRVFAFTINDPLYKESVDINTQIELNTSSPDNRTIKVLREFQKAFEDTLVDASSISSEEYLDLYFEYIFSQIIQ